ncbi:MAG: radical SAM protein [Deltaproteobacteria bacterium]|nr:radical SAM protein [Deltaproteobacteria bacterium]
MRYEGPVYRPPSEANSLLIQATVGCPHNKCTFCMVYKKGPPYKVRPVRDIIEDIDRAKEIYGPVIPSLFFPAGNTIAMPTDELAQICAHARYVFSSLKRITVYGSSQYIYRKGLSDLVKLKENGLSRIHVGLESGDDEILRKIKKGTNTAEQIQAGKWVKEAGIELSEYVMLGVGGKVRTREHAEATAKALTAIDPDYIRLRTFIPKVNTLLLHQIKKGRFQMLSAHEVLMETRSLIENIDVTSRISSDHYTNYIDVSGWIPKDRESMLKVIDEALKRDESTFRAVFVGTQ